jgi:hypothetical protein
MTVVENLFNCECHLQALATRHAGWNGPESSTFTTALSALFFYHFPF